MNLDGLFYIVLAFLTLYQYILFIYILLTWLPAAHETIIFRFLKTMADPFFRVFKGWLRFGYFDLTPIIGLILYGLLLEFVASNMVPVG